MRALLTAVTMLLVVLSGCGGGGGGGDGGDNDVWQGTWILNTQETDWGVDNYELGFYVGSNFKIYGGNSIDYNLVYTDINEGSITGSYTVDGDTLTFTIDGDPDSPYVGHFVLSNDNTKVTITWEDDGSIEVYNKQPANPVYAFGTSYLQYRVYEDETGVFAGWLPITKNGVPIKDTDIVTDSIKLIKPDNTIEPATNGDYEEQIFIHLDCSGDGPCVQRGSIEHAYWRRYASLEAGTYRFEVKTADGQTLTKTIPYPGQLVLPVVTIDAMQSAWDGNNLVLNWANPVGAATWPDVDKLRIVLYDGSGTVVLVVQMKPTATSVTLDNDLLNQARDLGDGMLQAWEVQTRAYDDKMNFARSTLKLRKGIEAP